MIPYSAHGDINSLCSSELLHVPGPQLLPYRSQGTPGQLLQMAQGISYGSCICPQGTTVCIQSEYPTFRAPMPSIISGSSSAHDTIAPVGWPDHNMTICLSQAFRLWAGLSVPTFAPPYFLCWPLFSQENPALLCSANVQTGPGTS